MSPDAALRPPGEPRAGRWLPLLLVPVSLLPDLARAAPTASYFFRDFTVTFLPLRLFAARELRAGRLAAWNPYLFEGTFQVPALYPPDLLHALWPSAAWVSWLLTLHLPLAALAAYWLARELGAARAGAFVAGASFALGGFAQSCLNLYVFLQALALAPFVVGLLRRAARDGGRAVALAAAVLALALSTLAVEFVAQAVVLGVALGLVAAGRAGLVRLAAALALGAGLAALPVALVLGLLPETARGAGFASDVALANAVQPVVLLQALLPRLFGLPSAPAEAWWGGRFFSKGLPYFLSLYMGPLVLGLAASGYARFGRRDRLVLCALAALGLWYALGTDGGLAPLLQRLPLAPAFRFPGKALLLPYLALALAAGLGADRLQEGAGAFSRLAVLVSGTAALALALAGLLWTAPGGLVAWSGVSPAYWPTVAEVVRDDALYAATSAAVVVVAALAARRGSLRLGIGVALVAALVVADLARASAGLNRQVGPSFFEPLPELAALPLRDLAGGRVFSYGLDHSPAFRAFLASDARDKTLTGFFLQRQILGPYTSALDGVETAEANDLTAFAPRGRELSAEAYDPARAQWLLPWLRQAAVSRVLSLDPLASPGLVPLGAVAAGPPGLAIRLYGVLGALPRAYVACRVVAEPDGQLALDRPYQAGFDSRRDVALANAADARCSSGWARPDASLPGHEPFDVEADAPGYLVVRASYARGWRARVDGVAAPVLRANGKHRAVPVPAGRHRVVLDYAPPGLRAGLVLTGLALLALGSVLATASREARP